MNYLDLLIIYLACGSPFGVFYFFNNRKNEPSVWFQSIVITFVWIPYGIKLLHSKFTEKLMSEDNLKKGRYLDELQRNLEGFLSESKSKISLFELREIIERYKELTLINSDDNCVPANHEKEIFRITGNCDVELASICLNRRNLQRLNTHQTYARVDFISALKILLGTCSDREKLSNLSLEFVRIINDRKGHASVKALFDDSQQNDDKPTVKDWEKEKWRMQEQPLSHEKQMQIPIRALSVTSTLLKKD